MIQRGYKFKDTHLLNEEARRFVECGYYTDSLVGTPSWKEYWDEQARRCKEGYSAGGTYITGEHYFYLNFCPIKKVVFDVNGRPTKISTGVTFPDFWDGDYDFFWIKHIASYGIDKNLYSKLNLPYQFDEEDLLGNNRHLIIGKARRKGFSYKNAALAIYMYTFFPKSVVLLLASDKKYLYPNGIMTMVKEYSNFLNEYTGFKRNKLINKQDLIKSGFIEDGIEKGYKSVIQAISLKDDPDGVRGKDPTLVIFEEAGAFSNLRDAYSTVRPSVQAGSYTTGQIIIFGTGGDTDGATMDFEMMFNDPDGYGLMSFRNIWDDTESRRCGWFIPVYQNKEGFIDKDGNSLIEDAINSELSIRENIKSVSKDKTTITKYMIEFPFTPKEAFSVSTCNIFPVYELVEQLRFLENSQNVDTLGVRGYLYTDSNGRVLFNKDDTLREVSYPVRDGVDKEGCVVIYEQPVENPPYGLYIAGLDPYAQDTAESSTSLGSLFIYKRNVLGFGTGDRIVAEYTGRPATLRDFNENCRKLLLYYNAVCLYENQINNIKEYFTNKNCLYLLADTPTCLKSTVNTLVRRGKGIHMTKDIKLEVELYLRDWLLELNYEGVPNLKFIYSKNLLKELIQYNYNGNFDRVIALMLCIIYKLELTKLTVVKREEDNKYDKFFTRPLFVNRKKLKLNYNL